MSAPEGAAVTPGQAARTELEAAVRLAITENRDCRGSVPCVFCERRAAEALAAVDAYVAARQSQPAPETPAVCCETIRLLNAEIEMLNARVAELSEALAAEAERDADHDCHGNGGPQPAPELAAAMAETRQYREALERIFRQGSLDRCTCSIVAGITRRALEGK